MSISDGENAGGLPRGPHSLTRSYVARNQRERLLAAMVEGIAENGFGATSVTDVIVRAGVSRKTFYAQFRDRTDCLLAAHAMTSKEMLKQIEEAARQDDEEGDRLKATLKALCDFALQSPGGIRLLAVEIAAGGQEGIDKREGTLKALAKLLGDGLAHGEDAPHMQPPLLSTLAGSALRLIDLKARGSLKEARSVALARSIASWLSSYQPAPAGIAEEASIAAGDGPAPLGGRAPGTLSLSPQKLVAGTRNVSPSLTAHSQRERILDAVAEVASSKGYMSLTVDEACGIAGVSLNTFYEHFENKRDAFLVAHELGHIRGVAIVERAIAGAESWQDGVREGVAALLSFLSSEPAFARLAAVEAPIATPETAARVGRHIAAYAGLLLGGAPSSRRPPAIAPEGIASSLHELVFAYASESTMREIPGARRRLAYIVLAPHLGPERAADASGLAADAAG